MCDEDDFLSCGCSEGGAELGTAYSYVSGFVVKITLDETFDEVEYEPGSVLGVRCSSSYHQGMPTSGCEFQQLLVGKYEQGDPS